MSEEMSLVWLTMSKAVVRSMAIMRSEGQARLKPLAISCVRGRRADTVEWMGRKP